ncbi:putative Chaperone protein DnaJ [Pillotina sp. SPG140]|jgi:hypothetical protein
MDYYEILGVDRFVPLDTIKKAFREKAKRIHPDIGGADKNEEMMLLLNAYHVLSSAEERYAYDQHLNKKSGFDYRTFLRERADPASLAKLVLFDLFHHNEEAALRLWRKHGGIEFHLECYLDREDWMDTAFVLAEELEKRNDYYEAVMMLIAIIKEERQRPYFRHFTVEVESRLRILVCRKLKAVVSDECYLDCLTQLLNMRFSNRDEQCWLHAMIETLIAAGDLTAAQTVFNLYTERKPNKKALKRLQDKLEKVRKHAVATQ